MHQPGEGWRWLAHRKTELEGKEKIPWGGSKPGNLQWLYQHTPRLKGRQVAADMVSIQSYRCFCGKQSPKLFVFKSLLENCFPKVHFLPRVSELAQIGKHKCRVAHCLLTCTSWSTDPCTTGKKSLWQVAAMHVFCSYQMTQLPFSCNCSRSTSTLRLSSAGSAYVFSIHGENGMAFLSLH